MYCDINVTNVLWRCSLKTKEIVLCDTDAYYATNFASYLMERISDLSIHIYTTTESYFSDTREYDVGLLTAPFVEMDSFRKRAGVKKKFLLCDGSEDEDLKYLECIDKYSSMDEIMSKVIKASDDKSHLIEMNLNECSSIVGVYSPISHELQLPFSMALCRSYSSSGRVLFVDLEEISIMNSLTGQTCDKNMLDLLYMLSSDSTDEVDLNGYINEFMGFEYIPSFVGPDEINEISKLAWQKFFNSIIRMGYEKIVVLFGRAIDGFGEIVQSLEQLIILSKSGDFYKKSTQAFINYLETMDIDSNKTVVDLPMSAGNLIDGGYCIEELLMGNLGAFAGRLISDGYSAKNEVAYG